MNENELRAAMMAELNTDELKKIPEDFFTRVNGLVARLQEERRQCTMEEMKTLFTAKIHQINQMRDTLVKARLLKLFSLFLKTKNPAVMTEKYKLLTKEEKQLFQQILEAMNRFWTDVSSIHVQKDIAYKETKITDVHERHQNFPEKRLVLVEILEHVPKYFDDVGYVRGPHEPGDIISISEEIAFKILSPKGKARLIETTRD